MNTEQKREAIRLKVVEIVPEILELKFGCYIKEMFSGVKVITHRHILAGIKECWGVTTGTHGTLVEDNDIQEIIGRPILAQDILRALGDCYAVSGVGYILKLKVIGTSISWNFTKILLDLSQNLSEWSAETIDELYKLMCE